MGCVVMRQEGETVGGREVAGVCWDVSRGDGPHKAVVQCQGNPAGRCKQRSPGGCKNRCENDTR